MTGPTKVSTGSTDPLAGIASLISTLGGSQTTANSGDTAALQQVLGQLQTADYTNMLQTIFQQAGGAIPGLQRAYGNAMGARSGGNSAVQAALSQLLQQTTLGAQQQLADQQLKNQQLQTQAGSAIAQATKGTNTKVKSNVGDAAKLVAGLQLFGKLRKGFAGDGSDDTGIGGVLRSITGALGGLGKTDYGQVLADGGPDPIISAPSVYLDSPSSAEAGIDLGSLFGDTSGDADMGAIWEQFSDNNMINTDFMGPPNLQDAEYLDLGPYL